MYKSWPLERKTLYQIQTQLFFGEPLKQLSINWPTPHVFETVLQEMNGA